MPVRAEQLQVAVEPGDDHAAALDQAAAQGNGPAQRVSGAQALGRAQPVGVQQRQPGQEPGIQPVGLDVLGVVVPQVRGLLRRDHDHGRAMAAEPGRQRHPGIAGRLHHHRHRRPRRDLVPQLLQVSGRGAEPAAGPGEPAGLVGQAGLVGGPAGNIDPERHLHGRSSFRLPANPAFGQLEEARARHSLTGIRPAAGHRVLNRALPSSAAPPPAPWSTGKKSR